MAFKIYPEMLTDTVDVLVVGAGGTGSQMLLGLAQLDRAMKALGHPGGLNVVVYDDDFVSEANVGRQMFFPSDIGQPKATVLVNRINMSMGTRWEAVPARFTANNNRGNLSPQLVIGCVDNRKSRKGILEAFSSRFKKTLWLDIGNNLDSGQILLGEIVRKSDADKKQLPNAADLFPEIIDASLDGKDTAPSCSLAEALEKQALFINRGVSTFALNLLWQLFRYGELEYHGGFVNMRTGRSNPIPVDAAVWKRMGYGADKPAVPKKTPAVAKR